MSENKKAMEKATKAPAKAERGIAPRKREPTEMIASFDNMLEDLRRRFREGLWSPWGFGFEPYLPMVPEFSAREVYSDLVDEGSKYVVRAEVPGISKEKLDINVTSDAIEISGETSTEKKEKEANYLVRERSYSNIYKKLSFPEEVIPEKAEATVKDGVLEVSVAKKTPTPEPRRHKVTVK